MNTVDDGRLIRDSRFVLSYLLPTGQGSFVRKVFGSHGLEIEMKVEGLFLEKVDLSRKGEAYHTVLLFQENPTLNACCPIGLELVQELQAKIIEEFDERSTREPMMSLGKHVRTFIEMWAHDKVTRKAFVDGQVY